MYHLVCVHPFHGYEKGQLITDPDEVAKLINDRDHHFVKIMDGSSAAPAPRQKAK